MGDLALQSRLAKTASRVHPAPWIRPSARRLASYRAGWERSPRRTVGASSASIAYDNIGNLTSVTQDLTSDKVDLTDVISNAQSIAADAQSIEAAIKTVKAGSGAS